MNFISVCGYKFYEYDNNHFNKLKKKYDKFNYKIEKFKKNTRTFQYFEIDDNKMTITIKDSNNSIVEIIKIIKYDNIKKIIQ